MVGNDYLTFVSLPAFRGGRYGAAHEMCYRKSRSSLKSEHTRSLNPDLVGCQLGSG